MKHLYTKFILLVCLAFTSLFSTEVFAAATNYTFGSPSISSTNNTGCALSNYTFTQKTANNNGSKISIGAAVTVIFPAGMNLTTATCLGSTMGGLAVPCVGWSIVGQTISFLSPAAVGKNASFNIVIANVTNGGSNTGNASVSVVNNSGGNNSYTGASYAMATSACPAAVPNDNCSGANGTPVVLTAPAAGSSVCTATNGSSFGATASTQTVCGGTADDDVWFSFVATNTNHQITVDGVVGFNAYLQVMGGTCAAPTSLSCINDTGDGGAETSSLTGLTVGTTYRVRVYHNAAGAGVNAANSFTICVTSTNPVAGACAGFIAGDLTAASLPYTSGAQTTCGGGNTITSTNSAVCGSSLYYGGEDKIVKFTPAASGNVAINLTSTGSYVGMMLYNGCPNAGGTCVASAASYSGNQSIGCAPVTSGQTYYLVVDSWPTPTCNPFNVTISAPTGGIPLGTTCGNPQPMTLPYTATAQSTLCFGDDYTNGTSGVGTTSYMSGEDKVYSFTTTGPECIGITITNADTYYVGWHVFSGCPGAGGTLVGRAEGSSAGTLSGSVTVPGAGTYYLMVDTYASPYSVNYNLNVISLGTGPSNDVCTGAVAIALGTSAGGDNNCTGTEAPAAPACWVAGTMNTVWYTAVAPASGKLKVKVTAGSLTNPQVALYSGTCGGGLTMVAGACNDNVSSCGGASSNDAELNLTGLTNGTTYYIRVDGYNNMTGTFSVFVDDGNNALPLIPGQDCGDPNPVCQSLVSVANPGYSGYGNVCDLPSTYCLFSAERHIVWYRVVINVDGTFGFNITPNDFVQASLSETDYDFGVWRIAQSGGVLGTDYYNCAQIAAGTAPPVACNYSGLGVTGVAGAAGAGPGAGGLGTSCPQCTGAFNPNTSYDFAYEPLIDALNGETYLIAVSNFSGSSAGFRMNFLGTAGIAYENAATLATTGLTWSGGDASTPTVWTDVDNWGGCAAPSCDINTYIQAFASQPVLVNGSTYTTEDIVIGPGSTLTLNAGSTLEICGNFTNNGTFTAAVGSTVIFKGTGTQTISGSFTGTNKFGNLIVYKASGTVVAGADVEIGGTFSTANATSIFNSNNKYITIGGNFRNFSGNTTFTNTGTLGTLEFNGTGAQVYSQGAAQLDLNKVVLNNTAAAGSGVNLTGTIALVATSLGNVAAQNGTDMFIKATTGTLTLTEGTITTGGALNTGASATITGNRVHVLNTAAASVSAGSTLSYVDGTLRRYHVTGAIGAFNWPVGKASVGYQRAYTNFTASSANSYIDCRFEPWPTACTLGSLECSKLYDQPSMNNGMWTFLPSGAGTYTYDCTLYPLNATNILGTAWTIIKRPHTSAFDNTGWTLNGTCATSSSTAVVRTGMTNFSFLGVDQGVVATPVELLYFKGHNEGSYNKLEWETAAERENDYFDLERSKDGSKFEFLTKVDGAGNSNVNLYYTRNDNNPFAGVTYYRLRQVDFNGTETFSNVVALSNNLGEISMSSLFPNPTNSSSSFNFFTPVKGNVTVKLIDNSGRIITDKTYKVNEGNSTIDLEIEKVAMGIYNVEVSFDKGDFTGVEKLVKQH